MVARLKLSSCIDWFDSDKSRLSSHDLKTLLLLQKNGAFENTRINVILNTYTAK